VGGSRQSLIEAALRAARKARVSGHGDIERIDCRVNTAVAHIDHRDPKSWLDSRFSHAYCTAVTVLDGSAAPVQFEATRFAVGDVQALMKRVNVIADDAMPGDPTRGFPTRIEVLLTDGRRVVEECGPDVGEHATAQDSVNKIDLACRDGRQRGAFLLDKLNSKCSVSEFVDALGVRDHSSVSSTAVSS